MTPARLAKGERRMKRWLVFLVFLAALVTSCSPKVVEKVVKETVIVERIVKETVIVEVLVEKVAEGAAVECTPKVVERIVKQTVIVEAPVEKGVRETVVVEVPVEKVVEKVVKETVVVEVEKIVEVTRVVEKEVERVITATPPPPTRAPTSLPMRDLPGARDFTVVPRPPFSRIVEFEMTFRHDRSYRDYCRIKYEYDDQKTSHHDIVDYYVRTMPTLGWVLIESVDTDSGTGLTYQPKDQKRLAGLVEARVGVVESPGSAVYMSLSAPKYKDTTGVFWEKYLVSP